MRKAVDKLRVKYEETEADVLSRLIGIGFDDPATNKLSPSRVLPGYVFATQK